MKKSMLFLEIGAHERLQVVAVVADQLFEQPGAEHGLSLFLLFDDDLQQDAARDIFAALGVDDAKMPRRP